jgi:hypothetical protein
MGKSAQEQLAERRLAQEKARERATEKARKAHDKQEKHNKWKEDRPERGIHRDRSV